MIGYNYFQKDTFPWRYLQQAIIPLAMPHISPKLTSWEQRQILMKKRAILLRWDEDFDQYKTGEWWHIIKDEAEDISLLPKKTRYMIRKGEKVYKAKLCDRSYISLNAYPVYKSAFDRYNTFEKCFTEKEFRIGISSLPECTEFWSVFENTENRLVAFSENLVRDNACFYSTMWLEPKAMKSFAGYVLFHEMNKYYLNEKKVRYVSDGARSISHKTNIHNFLQSKFAFRKAYSKLNVVYIPGVYLIISLLLPFRNIFKGLSASVFQKIHVLLEQERIRRSCENQLKINFSRTSLLVQVVRLLQKLPLSFLRVFEKPIVQLSRKPNQQENMLILLALPRSGSTLTYQMLIHGLSPIYLSNLSNFMYELPFIGGILSKIKCKKYISDFQSNQGFVGGLCGPAEGLRFWSYWLNSGVDERDMPILSPENLKKKINYIKKVFSLLGRADQPIVTGYLGHVLSVALLKKIFPRAIFIRLHRNPINNALSILESRKLGGDNWFSVFPQECTQHLGNGLHAEIAAQVYWLNRRIDDETDAERMIHIDYEVLCREPNKELTRIINICNEKGMSLQQQNFLPDFFECSKVNKISNSDATKLKQEFEILENHFGKLCNYSN